MRHKTVVDYKLVPALHKHNINYF